MTYLSAFVLGATALIEAVPRVAYRLEQVDGTAPANMTDRTALRFPATEFLKLGLK